MKGLMGMRVLESEKIYNIIAKQFSPNAEKLFKGQFLGAKINEIKEKVKMCVKKKECLKTQIWGKNED